MRFVALIGRILFSAYFILASFGNFSPDAVARAVGQGMPLASFLVPLFGLIAIVGGFSVLLGFKARYGAWLLAVLLIIAPFAMHPFWRYEEDMMMMQRAMFFHSLALLGGALIIAYFGSGPFSLDRHPLAHRFFKK